MKYIRTDEGIYEFKEEYMSINKGIYYLFGKLEETSTDYLFKNDVSLGKVIKQANTIQELCDVFIFKDTCANEWHIVNQNDGISMLGASLFSDTLKGYIETEKGLIPVAKYGKEGFECL